jgi:hypothetical protein
MGLIEPHMPVATRLHKAIALLAACLLIVCNLVALAHQAAVAHVLDARTGLARHALTTSCRDAAEQTHAHQVPGQPDLDSCELTAALHQPAVAGTSPVLAVTALAPIAHPSTVAPPAIVLGSALLHVAPKTSPPPR